MVVAAGCSYSAELDVDRLRCDDNRPCPAGQPCSPDGYCRGAYDLRDSAVDDGPLAGYAAAVLAGSPIVFVRLDDAGQEQVADSSGNLRHGSADSGVAGANGIVGTAASFDGGGARIGWSDDSAIRLDGSFTIELWAKLISGVNTYPGLVHKGFASSGGYLIYYTADTGQLAFKRDGQIFQAEESMTDSGFRHLVVSYDAATQQLRWYVDGVISVGYSEVSFPPGADGELNLGVGDEPGHHVIDEFALYDHALDSDAVLGHFAAALDP